MISLNHRCIIILVHKMNHASVAHKMLLKKEYVLKCLWMNVFTFSAKNGIVENSLRILDLCRTPETDSTNPWGWIETRLRTTGLIHGRAQISVSECFSLSL